MWNRRDFAKLAAAAAIAPSIGAASKQPDARRIIKPKRLVEGQTVGLVSPASASFEADSIELAKDQLEAMGLKVRIGAHAFDRWGYFAGRDRDRADDINKMFADDDIAGIVCYTGGWGSPRVLPYLDYALIARKPKVIIGYSDITALLNAIHKRTGLVTFHGPGGSSTIEPYSLENWRRVVMSAEPAGELRAPGKASGRLIGGNLTMVATLMGTPDQLVTDGRILFLEDVHEEPYRIDRMLSQLAQGGIFDRIAGFVWGRCSDCLIKGPSFSIEDILRDRFGEGRAPAISGLSFGHIDQKLTLPIGVMATLDANAGTLTIDEAAVL